MALTTAQIQQAYVTFFSRPADVAGLNYWSQYPGSIDNLYATFAQSAEYAAAFNGLTNNQKVSMVYQNLFGRAADAPGLSYWTLELDRGAVTVANLALALANGAQGSDIEVIANRVTAATSFTSQLDTTPEILAYSGDNANAIAKAWLANVTDAASLATATTPDALNAVVQSVVSGGGLPGQTFMLTVGADTITGTAGNDTIKALTVGTDGTAATTLSAFDAIDGGAGNDTLNIYSDGTDNTELPTSATVKNVETINIYNDTVAFDTEAAGTNLDASRFEGATNINQVGLASATMTKLAATTTATFTDLAGATIDVEAASAATSITVALADVDDASSVALRSTATGLTNAFTISGTVVDSAADGVDSITVSIEGGKDVKTLTLNTAVASTLTVVNNGAAVTTVNAAASAGDITYAAANTVANITTGTGADNVDLQFQASATSKAATVSTGEGDDTLSILVNANGQTGVTVTADAGAGDDVVDIGNTGTVAVNFTAGAGNDEVTLTNGLGSVATTDVVDGGEGTDKVVLDVGGTGTLVAEDYIILRDVITGFEAIEFNTTDVTVDASRMSAYKDITLDQVDGTFTKVADDQVITAYNNSAVTLTATGYDDSGATTVYAGSLKVNVTGDDSTINTTVNAQSVNLTVSNVADTDGVDSPVEAVLLGDIVSATVTLEADTDTNGTTADTTDDSLDTAAVTVTNVDGGDLDALASLTISGNGTATVTNVKGTALATVNASALNSVDIAGDAVTGLVYTTTNTSKAETITLGGGLDTITFGVALNTDEGSTFAKMDTVTGLNLVEDAATANTVDTALSDDIAVFFGGVAVTTFAKATTTATTLDLALVDLAASTTADNVVFAFGGNTYIYVDDGVDDLVTDSDVLVKLTGTVDLDLLVDALNN